MADVSEDEIKRELQQMDPYIFEELVAEIWESQGYQTTVRKGSGDRGIDIEATKQIPVHEKVLIQAKRYAESNKVGSKIVREYATLYQQLPDADSVVIATSSEFTSQAEVLARDLNVKLVDGNKLVKMIKSSNKKVLTNLSTNPSKEANIPSKTKYSAVGPFEKCPICDHTDLQFESSNEETCLKCLECGSEWKKNERVQKTGGWLNEKVRELTVWRGVAGKAEGRCGSTDEWKHHSDSIDSNSEDSSTDNKNSGFFASLF